MAKENLKNFSDAITLMAMRYKRDSFVEQMNEAIMTFTEERNKDE